jgi:hypothetical protein
MVACTLGRLPAASAVTISSGTTIPVAVFPLRSIVARKAILLLEVGVGMGFLS